MFGFEKPSNFQMLGHILLPVLVLGALGLLGCGLYYGLMVSPPDFRQGETVRIMYIHVPSAWLSMGIYSAMTVAALIYLIRRHALAEVFIRSAIPVGLIFTFICLVTGSIWGKPTWGTWWVWDARLTSVLILFFIYAGLYALFSSYHSRDQGNIFGSIMVLAGAINIPIIKYSVEWWNTLHQPPSISSLERIKNPAIAPEMLLPLLLMAGGFLCYAAVMIMIGMHTEMNQRTAEARALRQSTGKTTRKRKKP